MRQLQQAELIQICGAKKDVAEFYIYGVAPASSNLFTTLLPQVANGTLSLEAFAHAILEEAENLDGSKVKKLDVSVSSSTW